VLLFCLMLHYVAETPIKYFSSHTLPKIDPITSCAAITRGTRDSAGIIADGSVIGGFDS
jgi:hypothetical protein